MRGKIMTKEVCTSCGFSEDGHDRDGTYLCWCSDEDKEISRLKHLLGQAKGDIHWMLNEKKFLSAWVFSYLDEFEVS